MRSLFQRREHGYANTPTLRLPPSPPPMPRVQMRRPCRGHADAYAASVCLACSDAPPPYRDAASDMLCASTSDARRCAIRPPLFFRFDIRRREHAALGAVRDEFTALLMAPCAEPQQPASLIDAPRPLLRRHAASLRHKSIVTFTPPYLLLLIFAATPDSFDKPTPRCRLSCTLQSQTVPPRCS